VVEKKCSKAYANRRASTLSLLLPSFNKALRCGLHTRTCCTCGCSRSYSHAAHVPSSQQLDGLQALRRNLRPEFLAESRKHKAAKLLRQIPCIGPTRAARLIALMQTPHRFRSKRQLWTYSGLGIETHDSAVPYSYRNRRLIAAD
jgi:hypothetical protein